MDSMNIAARNNKLNAIVRVSSPTNIRIYIYMMMMMMIRNVN